LLGDARVAELVEELTELPHLRLRDLEGAQDAAEVGPVVAVVIHRVRLVGLDADDLHLGHQRLDVAGPPGEQPPAADRDEDDVQPPVGLPEDLFPDRALARDDEGVVFGITITAARPRWRAE
jgi:hypothetical protein